MWKQTCGTVSVIILLAACSAPESPTKVENSAAKPKVMIHTKCPVVLSETGEGEPTEIVANLSGICPLSKIQSLTFTVDLNKPLNREFSIFTVTDTAFNTRDVTSYFSYDENQNRFTVTEQNVRSMWTGLGKGRYVFTANPISEDWDYAAIYEFEFEIR